MTSLDRKQKILIVDDDPVSSNMLYELLHLGNEVLMADTGAKALEVANSESPDLILLDVMLPDTDGYTVCQELKKNIRTAVTPIIFISAMTETDDEVCGFKAGAVDYITKPISAPIMLARVKTHLELKRYRDLLEDLSNIDGLTGIANRRRFDSALSHEWGRSMRAGSELSLIILDIDYFKEYNDLYGHATGDACIKKIAQTLRRGLLRKTDLAARYGGDEFACILSETDAKGAKIVAQTLHESVKDLGIRHDHEGVRGTVSISMGVATAVPSAGSQLLTLIEAADSCLYEAKKEGRDQIRWTDLGLLSC